MADPKESKTTAVADSASMQARNTIHVAMVDLAVEDRSELEHKLEEEMAERRRGKLACAMASTKRAT
jgi:hypothetical protein